MQAGTGPAAAGAQRLHAQRLANGDFMLPRCRACRALHFPPRVVCPACGGTGFDAIAASGRGVVASATVVRASAASSGDRSVCLVDLEEGPRLMSRVDGLAPEQVSIGVAVVARVVQGDAGAPVLVFQRLAEVEREAGAEQAPADHRTATDRVAR